MELLHIILFELACVHSLMAENEWYSSDVSKKPADLENLRVSCEMNEILQLLMCGEDEITLSGTNRRDLVMVLGNSLSGKSTLTEYVGDIKLKSVLVSADTLEYTISRNYINFQQFYSLTVTPQLVYNKKTNTTFYDCPSFSSFQNFSSAVVSSYLLKKVIDLADRVKIILTVSYPTVASGESERDLLSLLVQTASFIKNITHFHRGIALMVTKVENRWLENRKLVDDFTVREEIEEFILDFTTNWILDQTEDYPFDNKYMYEKVLNLTDILLSIYTVDGNNMPIRNDNIDIDEVNRIGLFRRPNIQANNLSEVPILSERKQRVLATIHEATKFTTVGREDFSYILGTDGIALAYSVSETTNELLTNKTGLISNYFAKHFEKGGRPYDIYLTNSFFTSAYPVFKEMYLKIYRLKEINELPEILSHAAQKLKINIPNEYFVDLKVNIDFMLFVKKLVNHLDISVSEWIEPFWSIYESLRWSKIWYTFLNSLNKRLISPDIRGNLDKYDVQDIEDWGKGSPNKGIFINEFNYESFIEKLEQYNLDSWDDIIEYMPTAIHMEDLNTILNISFHGIDQTVCEDDNLKFTGRILQTSMIRGQNCTPKVITLFSSQLIEIDKDIDFKGEKVNIILVAPNVIVRGDRKIDVSGKDGEKKHDPIMNINFVGENGTDGVAGSPGNASGNIVFICSKIMGDGTLKIFTQGGRGTDGQSGGLGGIGISRTSSNVSTDLKSKDNMPTVQEYDACDVISKTENSASFKLMKCGICGGPGGNGGKGGEGGPAGTLNYYARVEEISSITKNSSVRHGKDGRGGRGGINGKTVEYTFTTNFPLTDDEMCGKVLSKSCPVCSPNEDGITGIMNAEDAICHDAEVARPDVNKILDLYIKDLGDHIDVADVRKKFATKTK